MMSKTGILWGDKIFLFLVISTLIIFMASIGFVYSQRTQSSQDNSDDSLKKSEFSISVKYKDDDWSVIEVKRGGNSQLFIYHRGASGESLVPLDLYDNQ